MELHTIVRRLRGAVGTAVVWGACWFAATLAAVGARKLAGEPVVWADAWRMAARVGVMGGLAGGATAAVFWGIAARGSLMIAPWAERRLSGRKDGDAERVTHS